MLSGNEQEVSSLMIPIWELEGVCRTYIVGRVNSDALVMRALASAIGHMGEAMFV